MNVHGAFAHRFAACVFFVYEHQRFFKDQHCFGDFLLFYAVFFKGLFQKVPVSDYLIGTYPVFEYEMFIYSLLLLNNKKFIITNSPYRGECHYLCEIQSDEIKLIEEKKKLIYFRKYPGNKLIRKEKDNTIVVYEFK